MGKVKDVTQYPILYVTLADEREKGFITKIQNTINYLKKNLSSPV